MADVSSILVSNFAEALKQLNTYLSLGLSAALSALVIELQTARHGDALAQWAGGGASGPPPGELDQPKPVKVPFAAGELNSEHAKWLLLAGTLVAGLMSSMATLSASATASALNTDPGVLRAICTFPSIATIPTYARTLAGVSPAVLAGAVMWLNGRRLELLMGKSAQGARYTLLAPFIVIYGALAMQLSRVPC